MRFMKIGCYKMLKIIIFSIIGIFCICLIGCTEKKQPEEHVHTKVHVLKIEPTCISEGRIEYWFCSQCNKVFLDKDAKNEISWESIKLPKLEHSVEEDIGVLPTCETSGLTTGKHCSYCGMILEEQKEIASLEHNYDFTLGVWQWEEFESAKLVVPCSRNAEHKIIYAAKITSSILPATCTEAGRRVYTATVNVDDLVFEDQKEEIILPLEHDYDLDGMIWSWDQDTSAQAQILCKNDASHILTFEAALEVKVIPATCTTNGKKITTATVLIQGKKYTDVNEVEITAISHDYDYTNIYWTWNEYETATAMVTCLNDKEHKVSYDAKITSEIETPTCTTEGKRTYTASIMVDGESFTDYKEEVLSALNHNFDYTNIYWTWNEYETATAMVTCLNDKEHKVSYDAKITSEIEAPTCTTEGKRTYTASIMVDGESFTDYKEEVLSALNHNFDYTNIYWTWNEYETATATVICLNDKEHEVSYDAKITSEIETPTCTTEGKRTYTASIMVDGESFTDYKEEVLSALNHDFDYQSYTWEWTGYTQAIIHFACKNDKSHLDSYVGQIQSVIEPSTCVQEGRIIYTANVKLFDISYSAEKEEILPIDETAHEYDYTQPIWNWEAVVEGYTIFAEVMCKCGKSTLRFEDIDLSIDVTPATFESTGLIKYTAEIEFDGQKYFDIKTEELPMKEYVSTETEFLSAIKALAYELTLTNDITLTQEVWLTGNYAFLDLNGYTLFVSDGMLIVEAMHSVIENGYLVTEQGNSFGNYVLSADNQTNILLDHLTIVGGITLKNSKAIIRDVDITATSAYAVSLQEESKAVLESGSFRKNYASEVNAFFYVEGASKELAASSLCLEQDIQFYTTTHAALYDSIGVVPSYDEEPSIISMDIKDYLSSNLEYKCLCLSENLVYTDDEFVITGQKVIIDLNSYTWTIPADTLKVISSYIKITNGTLSILEEETGNVISIENGCIAIIENIHALGSIKVEDSSVTLTNVIINATIS